MQTTTRKNLNSVFESQGASIAESSPKESIDSSLISDDHNLLTESSGFVNSSVIVLLTEDLLLIPESRPSSGAVDPLAHLTPLSSTLTCDSNSPSDGKFGFVEAEMAVKYLRESQIQVVNATDIDIRYKKLLDTVMNTVVEEFYGLPQDNKDCYNTLVSNKFHLATLTFLLWIIAVFIGFFFSSGEKDSFYGTVCCYHSG
ncbi:hypothetical protein K7X08_032301 [Anisodus acutangulus]|uniref:Uncharacterized protein n=1 Tax=Anisodus acutangulus TaxID=402998 RepID=A0A9Q1LNT2_9SOLA|nr:hypothetical protein K7X08_032301 [Anisodus acutangulus]